MTTSDSLLGKYVEILSGYAFASQHFNTERRGLPLIRIRDVVAGSSDTFYDGPYDARFLIHPGEILIGMDGEFNRARWTGVPSLLNQRVCRIRSISPDLAERYLFHYLPQALKLIEDRTSFVTVNHISSKDIATIPVCLPPIDEQQHIAAILDQADDLRRKRHLAFKKLNEFPQAIFHEMFGDPVTNEMGWPMKPTGNVVNVIGGFAFKSTDFADAGPGIVRISNLREGALDLLDIARIPMSRVGKGAKYTISGGDILMAMSGATTGKVGVAPRELTDILFRINASPTFAFPRPISLVENS